MIYNYFELRRQSDDLIYKFDLKDREDGIRGYCRRDQDLWITYRELLGWVAYNEESSEVMGIPWQTSFNNQNPNHPPEGVWVSRKNEKSYVYDLIFPKK